MNWNHCWCKSVSSPLCTSRWTSVRMSCRAKPFRVLSWRISVKSVLRRRNCTNWNSEVSEWFHRVEQKNKKLFSEVRNTLISCGEVFVERPVQDVGYVWAEGVTCAGVHCVLCDLLIRHVCALQSDVQRSQCNLLMYDDVHIVKTLVLSLFAQPAVCWVTSACRPMTRLQWPSFHLELCQCCHKKDSLCLSINKFKQSRKCASYLNTHTHLSCWMTYSSRGIIWSGDRGPKRNLVHRDCRAGMILDR